MSSEIKFLNTHGIIKNLCTAIYVLGSGNFWYEPKERYMTAYKLYSFFLYVTIIIFILMEGLAFLFGDFPEDQANEALLYSVTHALQMVKVFNLHYYRQKIIKINHDMVKICEAHEKDDVLKKQARKAKIFVLAYIGTCYITAFFVIFSGLHRSITHGNVNIFHLV